MATAAALRIQIEDALATRFPAALTPVARTVRETATTGIAAVDTLLEGGLPVGAISELVGPECSGRTSLALAFAARRTAEGQVCAWIDAGDAFDPESAAASGVRLRQLLWVRCGNHLSEKSGKPWARLDQALRVTDSAFAGRRLCGHCAGPREHGPGARDADSTAVVVSISPGGRPHSLQPGGSGPGSVCAIERRCGVGLCAASCKEHGRNGTGRNQLRLQPPPSAHSAADGRDAQACCFYRGGSGCVDRSGCMGREGRLEFGEERMSRELYACVYAAEFPAQALLRLRADLKSQPVVVLDGLAHDQSVRAFNRLAAQRGVVHGLSRLEAESVAGLQLLARSLPVEQAAHAVLLEAAAQFSPRIEEVRAANACSFLLDVAGCELLFGPAEQMAAQMRNAMAAAGFRVSIAVSINFHVARIKAASGRGITIVPAGEEAASLAKLPISALELKENPRETFAI